MYFPALKKELRFFLHLAPLGMGSSNRLRGKATFAKASSRTQWRATSDMDVA